MDKTEQLDFLSDYLPEAEDYFDLFSDFRFGGYRILGDLICDIDDESNAEERKKLHRDTDSDVFTEMIYMWENDEPDIDRASRALCAWCSVPDNKKAAPGEEWQYRTDRIDLHSEFPELVDENGNGGLYATYTISGNTF